MRDRIILDLCGGTGAWSRPYADAGYDVRVIDPVCGTGDVRLYQPPKQVQGILAAPPCTVFSNAGVRWKRSDADMMEGLSVVDACLRIIYAAAPEWWAMENPVGKLIYYLGKWRYTFQPHDYGDPWTKRTCIWGDHMQPQTTPVEPCGQYIGRHENPGLCDHFGDFLPPDWVHKLPPGKNRAMLRSITPPGFAKAFMEANP